MNLDKLIKQFRRDLAANPKKAAALGLMVAVALYCWGPLVWGWIQGNKDSKTDQSQLAHLILTDDPLEPADKVKNRSKARFRWEKVRPLLAQDSRMVSATFEGVWIDPFGKPTAGDGGDSKSQAGSAAITAAAADAAGVDLGLTLSSIAIGPRRRAATINGERYFEGDELTATSKDGSIPPLKFRVAAITSQGVELACSGKTISLRLERSRLANGDAIERSGAGQEP